jgi:NADH-quinone oxidoreductase subunit C
VNVTPTIVDLDAWVQTWQLAHADGFVGLDFLTGIDRLTHIEILGRCVRGAESRFYGVEVADGALPTITDVFPAAAWHEREIAEMFGVRISGMDAEPLLTRVGDPPLLRKSSPLPSRVEKPWPGVGKRGRKPGVFAEWQAPS